MRAEKIEYNAIYLKANAKYQPKIESSKTLPEISKMEQNTN